MSWSVIYLLELLKTIQYNLKKLLKRGNGLIPFLKRNNNFKFNVRVTVPVSSNMLAGAFLLGGDMV